MSNKEKKETVQATPTEATIVEAQASQVEKLSESDVAKLDMAKMNKQVALSNAEKALAENKLAELAYKYTVLELYMKYGLTAVDALDEQGNIHYGVNKV